jgi:2-polyprenyl-6-methoxyphenol hydroxylase-like FAD-dependent oxidoreductase
MAEVKRSFKVLIVGGGPAGLSLALMLEKHDIDYNLFESHPQIECPGGAGIGIAPNGSYILDQLGAYQDVISAASGSIIYSFIRSFVGTVLSKLEHFDYHLVRRYAGHLPSTLVTWRRSPC